MAIRETPDDAAIRIQRVEGRLAVAPNGNRRSGNSAMRAGCDACSWTKAGMSQSPNDTASTPADWAVQNAGKRRFNGNVDKLIGAVNVWCWDKNSAARGEMKASGIDRILWSNRQSRKTCAR